MKGKTVLNKHKSILKRKLLNLNIKNRAIEYLYIIIGTYLMSLSVNLFMLPNKITTGGATGIGTILYYLMGINMSLTVAVINIPLFIIAIKKLGFKFSFRTIIATLFFTVFIEIFKYETIIKSSNVDTIISAIYGGIILGIGLSLVFKAGASTGGTDLIANIIRKNNKQLNINQIMLCIDAVIIIILIITLKNINIGLYSIISIYISSKLIEFIFEGVNYTKVITIISNSSKEISEDIIKILNRTTTLSNVKGAFNDKIQTKITCIVTMPEIARVKNIVKKYDNNAIVYVINTYEVLGNGFKPI